MNTNAKKIKIQHILTGVLLLLLSPLLLWYFATPKVTVYYALEGKEVLRFIWITQDRIYRGGEVGLPPGKATTDFGFIFPDKEFFMMFSWWSKTGRDHCVEITPKWRHTKIYLDLNGNIDTRKSVGTDVDRLSQCRWDRAKP